MNQLRHYRREHVPRPQSRGRFVLPVSTPLDIEIGGGTGIHAQTYAQLHPERFLVVLERTLTRFEKMRRRFEERPLTNLLALRSEATRWITYNIDPTSVDRYFILYPNPYPKSRHQNRRWHSMPFFEFLFSTLKPGGTLTLATNSRDYFDEARQWFSGTWHLEISEESEISPNILSLGGWRTHFEKKYLERGERCFNLVAKKRLV